MNILVVDDELIMHETYTDTKLFDWGREGFHLVGCAFNGSDALEMLRENDVDVVITDLKMPKMTGLELIVRAQIEFPEVRFIVMSAYNEFELVKKAYSLGIKEYFLKSELEPDDLIATLKKIRDELKERSDSSNNYPESKFDNKKVYDEKVLKTLIWGNNVDFIGDFFEKINLSIDDSSMCIFVLSLYNFHDVVETETWKGEREFLKYGMTNVLEEICRNYGNLYSFFNLPDEVVVIQFTERKNAFSIEKIHAFFEDVRDGLNDCFGIKCDCGYAGATTDFSKLKELYSNSKKAVECNFFCGHDRLIFFDDIKQRPKTTVDLLEHSKKIKEFLFNIEKDKSFSMYAELRITPEHVCYENILDVKNVFFRYYTEMLKFMETYEFLWNPKENAMRLSLPSEKQTTLDDFNAWLHDAIEYILNIKYNNRNVIGSVMLFVDVHYKENINIDVIAEKFNISSRHLNRLFQKNFGTTFMQYVLNIRMSKAKELLINTSLKVYEVADEVGYKNVEQFSKVFKKFVGKSPKYFRK